MTDKDIYIVRVKNYCITLAGQCAMAWIKDDIDFIMNSYEMKLTPIAAAKEILKLRGIRC
jgi:hypothetical protein